MRLEDRALVGLWGRSLGCLEGEAVGLVEGAVGSTHTTRQSLDTLISGSVLVGNIHTRIRTHTHTHRHIQKVRSDSKYQCVFLCKMSDGIFTIGSDKKNP